MNSFYNTRPYLCGLILLSSTLLCTSQLHAHGKRHNHSLEDSGSGMQASRSIMKGSRGVIELDWQAKHISRTLTAGYPDSFTLSSFLDRVPPKKHQLDGRQCLTANFLSFDVDDGFAYDIDETVELEFLLHSKQSAQLFYGYDRSGSSGSIGQFSIDPAVNQSNTPENSDWHKVTLTLERARFANRGMSGTDIALLTKATMLPMDTPESSTLTLCDLKLTRSHSTSKAATAGSVTIELLSPETQQPTPVRLGIYDESGRAVLPGSDALAIKLYDSEVTQLALRNFSPRSQPWPHQNRYVMFSDGHYNTSLPAGRYTLVASKGIEYRWLKHSFEVTENQQTDLSLTLERWGNMPANGWYSGDVHIHMNREKSDNRAIMNLLQAEDVHVSNLLLMSNPGGSHFSQYAYGKEGRFRRGVHTIVPGIEGPRTAQRGHTISLNIDNPLIDSDTYFLYHQFLQAYAEQGGVRGYAHVGSEEFNASWGLALDVPFGLVDFVEIMQNSHLLTDFWYEFLNLGYQLAPAAGSDFPYFDQPGAVRSYAQVSGDYTPQGWFNALRDGQTFVTNGPLLDLDVNGHPMGSSLAAVENKTLSIKASASINPDLDELTALELLVCGEVVKRVEVKEGQQDQVFELSLEHQLPAKEGMWLAVNAIGKDYAAAHSAPVYIQNAQGSSACAEKVPALVDTMKQRLDALEAAPILVHRELEYWETENLASQYQSQKPRLKQRIAEGHQFYDRMLERFEISRQP